MPTSGAGLLFRLWWNAGRWFFTGRFWADRGTVRTCADGTVVRRGLSEKTRERLTTPNERRLAAEVLTCRVQHFTKGVILGSRAFIYEWFAQHRTIAIGRSRTERKCGSKPLGRPAARGLYAFRDPKG